MQLESDMESIDAAVAKLKHDTEQLEEKLRMARTRQKALILRGKTAKSRIKVKRQINAPSYADALDRFENYERRLDEMEGEIESYDLGNRTLADEIDELEGEDHLNAELEALKNRIRQPEPPSSPAEPE